MFATYTFAMYNEKKGSGMQKGRFWTGVVYKRLDFRRERYTKGWILDWIGIRKDWIGIHMCIKGSQ